MKHPTMNLVCALSLTLLGACAESANGNGSGDDGVGAAGAGGGGGSTTATTATTGATSSSGAGGGSGPGVVVNELSATDDWIELFNASDEDVDLGDLTLADSGAEGAPKLDEAVTFPKDTTLPAFGYLLVVGKVGSPKDGPQTECLPKGGPETCYQAAFGISDTDGDTLFLLDPDGAELSRVDYPAGAVQDDESYGRLPDGSGDFTACKPTPAEPNQAP